jgi:hypothetical protein
MADKFAKTLSEAKVGDLLHVYDSQRIRMVDGKSMGRGTWVPEPFRVQKIGRDYLHAAPDGRSLFSRFNKETGHESSERGYSSSRRAYGGDDRGDKEQRDSINTYRLSKDIFSATLPQLLSVIAALGKTVEDYKEPV